MKRIGIDIGISLIKIVECSENGIMKKQISNNKDAIQELDDFLHTNNIDINCIDEICVTGINSVNTPNIIYSKKVKYVDEFLAVGAGALKLASKDRAIIASCRYWNFFYKSRKWQLYTYAVVAELVGRYFQKFKQKTF